MYLASPFEGVKKIEGEESTYFVVAVSYAKSSKGSTPSMVSEAQVKAQQIAEQGFAEPCVKFEMIDHIENKSETSTYLFLCTSLDQFITGFIKKKLVDGAKIVSAPGNKYIISNISLDNAKYASTEMRDKVAFMKSKQLVNTLTNGSTITSDQIVRTDETDSRTEVTNTQTIKEHAMGFIQGLELLFAREISAGKTTYVYFSKI